MRSVPAIRRGLGFFALAALFGAAPLAAQDFLFRDPRVSLSLRTGYSVPTVSSDVFDFAREELTVSKGDFRSIAWGAQLAIRATERIDVAVDLTSMSSITRSEFREWVDTNDAPIEQETTLARRPLTVGVKAYMMDRGRSIGRFAWIPRRWAPYVGAGGGWTWYSFEQEGDFVDFETLDIFPDRFATSGRAPTVYGALGADLSVGPSVFLTAEGRYSWAKADMGSDFVGFDRMDLSGFHVTAGVAVRF